MENQKLENLLNLALNATPEELEKSENLSVGYETEQGKWEVIVKYSGEPKIFETPEIQTVKLLGNFAILTLYKNQIEALANDAGVEFIEKPKRLFFAVNEGRSASCINSVQDESFLQGNSLFGEGVLVGCVDSGIDYSHPDFCSADGASRILRLWDQSVSGNPPKGYEIGTEYTKEQIEEALTKKTQAERYAVVPSRDLSGHGTGVMGIAAGNGRASNGVYRGVAPKSELIVVKLGNPRAEGFPRTTELMQGIDYCIRTAVRLGKPLALNLSFGNNYGSHDGEALLELYLDTVATIGRNVICVGTGNEGNKAIHTSGTLNRLSESVPLQIGDYERSMNLQIWKQYVDEIEFSLEHPNGEVAGPFQEELGTQRFRLENTEILIYYGEPKPFSTAQEIYIEFIPVNTYVDTGTWKINLIPRRIVDGTYDMWLPGGSAINQGTRFLYPMPETTLTIPSTAQKVISVGAYDSRYQAVADFSGRGYTRENRLIKPDLVAPGVNIMTTAVGGGYRTQTGTSFATPFVTGSAALLMEFGIVRGNDPYLYGEKVKAYLIRGARHLLIGPYPNQLLGWGYLCVKQSIPEI